MFFGLLSCVGYVEAFILYFYLHKKADEFPVSFFLFSTLGLWTVSTIIYSSTIIAIMTFSLLQIIIRIYLIKPSHSTIFSSNTYLSNSSNIVASFMIILVYGTLRTFFEFGNALDDGIMYSAGVTLFGGLLLNANLFSFTRTSPLNSHIDVKMDGTYQLQFLNPFIDQLSTMKPESSRFLYIGTTIGFIILGNILPGFKVIKGISFVFGFLFLYWNYFEIMFQSQQSILIIIGGFGVILFLTSFLMSLFPSFFFKF